MSTRTIPERRVKVCDRCKREAPDVTFVEDFSVSLIDHNGLDFQGGVVGPGRWAHGFDLCDGCVRAFDRFMDDAIESRSAP